MSESLVQHVRRRASLPRLRALPESETASGAAERTNDGGHLSINPSTTSRSLRLCLLRLRSERQIITQRRSAVRPLELVRRRPVVLLDGIDASAAACIYYRRRAAASVAAAVSLHR